MFWCHIGTEGDGRVREAGERKEGKSVEYSYYDLGLDLHVGMTSERVTNVSKELNI